MNLTEKAKKFEHYETPVWAAEAILGCEVMTPDVYDPCCGGGVLSRAALSMGYFVHSADIEDWGYKGQKKTCDFLTEPLPLKYAAREFTVFINPPFSRAVEFIERAIALGAQKIICFQRLAFFESADRRDFWDRHPPQRIYVCGNRAICWRYDLPIDTKGRRINPENGKVMHGASTAHAWFVWERGQGSGTVIHRLYKDDKGDT